MNDSLAPKKPSNALLTMLHDYVQVVVRDEVLNDSNRALLSLTVVLKRHCTFNLHHDALLEVWITLPEVLKLLDKEQGL